MLRHQLEIGAFTSPEEVVESALGLLAAPSSSLESLQAKIQEGLDDIVAGRMAPLNIEETIRRGRERLTVNQG